MATAASKKGTGTFVFADGGRYEGEYVVEGGVKKRSGKGTWTDGVETYTGSWKNDAMDGRGTFNFASGAVYEGEFLNNEFSGTGEYRFADAASYSGAWRQGKMHGKGTYTDPEGVVWTGTFHNGKFDNGKAHISLR